MTEPQINLNNPNLSYMTLFSPALEIVSQEEADEYFALLRMYYMMHCSEKELPTEEIEKAIRRDLGYWAGYYSHETRVRFEKLFGAYHPYFPSASEGPIDPEQALELGRKLAATLDTRSLSRLR